MAGLAVLARDREILRRHAPGVGPHGLDIQTLDPDGKVWTIEVKGTTVEGKPPRGDKYPAGRQGGAGYVIDRSSTAPVYADREVQFGADADQMGSLLVGVNIPDDTVTIWEVDADGNRSEQPLEIYTLSQIAEVLDETE